MLTVLWAASAEIWPKWQEPLTRALDGIARIEHPGADGSVAAPEAIDAIIYAPGGPVRDFAPFTKARLVQSLWAGVEGIVGAPGLTQPLARMVDPGLTEGMVEYCLGWVMRLHLRMDVYAQDGVWRNAITPPLARERKVTVLGTGALGGAVARQLAAVGFDVAGWSASGRPVEGVRVLPAGESGLTDALSRAAILVTLLPDTPGTAGLIDANRLALLPDGASIINPGRGTLIDDAALIAALDTRRLRRAVLDVFRTEPLPPDHPFWRHPGVTVTPHIAAETRPESAARAVADNLARIAAGEAPLHLVDRARGY